MENALDLVAGGRNDPVGIRGQKVLGTLAAQETIDGLELKAAIPLFSDAAEKRRKYAVDRKSVV